jgi:hypothetical protein
MPKTAQLTDKIAVLRAMATDDNAHSSSGYYMLTGQPHAPKNFENANPGSPNDWPSFAAMVRHLRGDRSALPSLVRAALGRDFCTAVNATAALARLADPGVRRRMAVAISAGILDFLQGT